MVGFYSEVALHYASVFVVYTNGKLLFLNFSSTSQSWNNKIKPDLRRLAVSSFHLT